mmetsp:Transcript_58355/g.142700  ORF Transcript_58355/g.142700 Transcript_58355/m.142700 type:complete len:450 (+) Transcript_58355:177-1526(+)
MFPSFLSTLFGEASSSSSTSPDGRSTMNEPITTKSTIRGTIQQGGVVSYAFSEMQGWRVTMEDAHLVCSKIPVQGRSEPLPTGHVIFGVMDGHGGDFTSEFAAGHFMNIFSSTSYLKKYAAMSTEDQSNVPGIECLRPALAETFSQLDSEIRKRQNKKNDDFSKEQQQQKLQQQLQQHRQLQQQKQNNANESPQPVDNGSTTGVPGVRFERSGSTCVVVLVTPSHIICANAGDSRAVLRRNGSVLPLSFDHKPNNVPELGRVNDAGGFVKGKRVDGDLAVSRGLGDFTYKSNETLPVNLQKVIPDPEFVVYPRVKEDEFMILACDGVWDVATNEQCSSFIQSLFDDGENDLGLICEEAIDTCLDKNSRDNMTIAVVTFDGLRTQQPSGLGISNAVWQRRATRHAKQLQQSAKDAATRAASNVGLLPDAATTNSATGKSSKRSSVAVAGS